MSTPEVHVAYSVQRVPSSGFSTPQISRVVPKYYEYAPDNCAALIPVSLWEAVTGEKYKLDIHVGHNTTNFFTTQMNDKRKYAILAKDRQSCRKLQDDLHYGTNEFRQTVLNSIIPFLEELICDPAANFVVQKLLEYASREHKVAFLQAFKQDPYEIANHPCGSRVMQKFIECADADLIDFLYLSVRSSLLQLCYSLHGNRIVQQFIDYLPSRVTEIIDKITPQAIQLVGDNCGCRVVQHLFQPFDQKKLAPLISEVIKAAPDLTINQYGNYVIQNIIDDGSDEQISALIKSFQGYFFSFSMHKFASNVIERCIIRADETQRNFIFTDIIGSDGKYDLNRIHDLICDKFGNYVIQRILEFGSATQQQAIFEAVSIHFNELVNSGYSKHVITKLRTLGFII